MFKKLQKKWGVNSLDFILIIVTFALGGSTCARVAELIMNFCEIQKGFIWWVIYLVLVTIFWPMCVLIISLPLGQFRFFKNYTGKILAKLFRKQRPINKICIFASGAGSNAEKIIEFFKSDSTTSIALIVTNNPNAGVINIAQKHHIPLEIISNKDFTEGTGLINLLSLQQVSFIVLAGFLKKIPPLIIDKYPRKILNIHPALLPNYGGAGMFGNAVHKAVIENKETESGITIHVVDELYDHGDIVFQKNCPVDSNETAETLANKIHQLEHVYYPIVIKDYIENQR